MKRHTSAPLGALLFLSCVCLIATHATIVRSMNMQGPPRPGAPGSGVPDEDGVIIPTFEEEEALDEQDIEFDNFETPEKRVCGLAYYKEKACADHAEQWENEFDAAKDWITVGGGYVHHALRVGWNPFSGRGLYTTYNLLNATTLFRIPTQFTFHNKTAYENEGVLELLRAARKDKVLFNSHTIFAVALLHEKTKGANSQWAPLIASLPSVEQLRHLPFYWPRDELNSLKGTFFQKVVTNQMATVVNAYQAVTKTAPKLMQNLGQQDDFQWAYLVSSTYQRWANFTHQVQHYSGFGAHAGLQPGFIPLVDLVNHPTYDAIRADRAELHNKNIETKQRAAGVGPHPMRYPIAVTDTVIEEGIPRQIKMYLVAPAKPGDQVFMYYGDMDDSHSLSTFGFVNHERDADTMTTALATNLTILFENSNNLTGRAWAPLDLPKSAPGYKEKVAFLKGKTVQSCILHVHDLGASACLSFLRLAVAPLSYTQKLGEFNFGVTSQGFIDLENEVAVWRAVGAVASNVTRDYMKIKVRKAEGAKPEKVTAMEAMELGGLKAIATDKYSKRIQLALRPILQELRTLKWFMQLGRAVSLPEGTTSATTPAEASLQFSEMIEKFDDVYYETHHSKLHFMREFLDALYKRRGTYDPLADVEADATVTATTKKAEPQDKIEL